MHTAPNAKQKMRQQCISNATAKRNHGGYKNTNPVELARNLDDEFFFASLEEEADDDEAHAMTVPETDNEDSDENVRQKENEKSPYLLFSRGSHRN